MFLKSIRSSKRMRWSTFRAPQSQFRPMKNVFEAPLKYFVTPQTSLKLLQSYQQLRGNISVQRGVTEEYRKSYLRVHWENFDQHGTIVSPRTHIGALSNNLRPSQNLFKAPRVTSELRLITAEHCEAHSERQLPNLEIISKTSKLHIRAFELFTWVATTVFHISQIHRPEANRVELYILWAHICHQSSADKS